MNQRRESRIEANQPARVTTLSESQVQCTGRVKNVSVRGVGLELPCPIKPGTAIRIELKVTLLLGEVIFCRDDEVSFYAGVELEHALFGLGDLQRAMDASSDSFSVPEEVHSVIERRYQN